MISLRLNSKSSWNVARSGIVAKQQEIEHPLASFGYRRPPHWLWRRSQRAYVVVAAIKDIWLIATGRLTLHRAWQAGYDQHSVLVFQADRDVPKVSEEGTLSHRGSPNSAVQERA